MDSEAQAVMHTQPHMLADKFDDDGDTSVITDTKPKTKRPPLYKVMLLNDDYEISRLGASGIAVLMIAALITHIRLNSKASKMLPSLSLLCVCLVISYMCTQLSPST